MGKMMYGSLGCFSLEVVMVVNIIKSKYNLSTLLDGDISSPGMDQ